MSEAVSPVHVPDGFRHFDRRSLPWDPDLGISREGDCFVAEITGFDPDDPGWRNHFHVGGKTVFLKPGDRVGLILACRRSMMEFASRPGEPGRFGSGDSVAILGGDGYAGSFECSLAEYGRPIGATILGGIPSGDPGRALNVAEAAAPTVGGLGARLNPLTVAVMGTRMDCGKSTTIRNLAGGLRRSGHRVVAGKVTGFGCRHETVALGGEACLDFTDYGLPSTCGPEGGRVIQTARRVCHDLKQTGADFVFLEFGGGLIDEYRVDEVAAALSGDIDFLIFVAFDLCGTAGGLDRLRESGLGADWVSGPVANTAVGISLIERHFGLAAESNRDGMERLLEVLSSRAAAITHPTPR